MEDRQTQADSAAPHQELVPYHQALRGSFWTPVQHSRSILCILYVSGNTNQEQIVLDKNAGGDGCVREEEKKKKKKQVYSDTF